jgi:hypothetical protein
VDPPGSDSCPSRCDGHTVKTKVGLSFEGCTSLRGTWPLPPDDLEWVRQRGVVAVAGVVAERISRGLPPVLDPLLRDIPRSDQRWGRGASLLALGNGQHRDKHIGYMAERVREAGNILTKLWVILQPVTPILAERRVISGMEFARLLGVNPRW